MFVYVFIFLILHDSGLKSLRYGAYLVTVFHLLNVN
jgi:hypothetical protein